MSQRRQRGFWIMAGIAALTLGVAVGGVFAADSPRSEDATPAITPPTSTSAEATTPGCATNLDAIVAPEPTVERAGLRDHHPRHSRRAHVARTALQERLLPLWLRCPVQYERRLWRRGLRGIHLVLLMQSTALGESASGCSPRQTLRSCLSRTKSPN
ncbi:MAG: hypothetical protein HC897_17805 [Thermoanaerobaculia bacterium]|nr:hypothetical protein [Thermoanaerobaculia bacterium]